MLPLNFFSTYSAGYPMSDIQPVWISIPRFNVSRRQDPQRTSDTRPKKYGLTPVTGVKKDGAGRPSEEKVIASHAQTLIDFSAGKR